MKKNLTQQLSNPIKHVIRYSLNRPKRENLGENWSVLDSRESRGAMKEVKDMAGKLNKNFGIVFTRNDIGKIPTLEPVLSGHKNEALPETEFNGKGEESDKANWYLSLGADGFTQTFWIITEVCGRGMH